MSRTVYSGDSQLLTDVGFITMGARTSLVVLQRWEFLTAIGCSLDGPLA